MKPRGVHSGLFCIQKYRLRSGKNRSTQAVTQMRIGEGSTGRILRSVFSVFMCLLLSEPCLC